MVPDAIQHEKLGGWSLQLLRVSYCVHALKWHLSIQNGTLDFHWLSGLPVTLSCSLVCCFRSLQTYTSIYEQIYVHQVLQELLQEPLLTLHSPYRFDTLPRQRKRPKKKHWTKSLYYCSGFQVEEYQHGTWIVSLHLFKKTLAASPDFFFSFFPEVSCRGTIGRNLHVHSFPWAGRNLSNGISWKLLKQITMICQGIYLLSSHRSLGNSGIILHVTYQRSCIIDPRL